ncbi:MAG: carbon-nitrogen hydrolase family protein [Acidaminococcaceae bacterium]|nr:carbon-nitrogen hydrolase family protein [Acidaminococcaceae bacterium]
MKILLCHLTVSLGPLEKNLKLLERALQIAGEVKADWVITPEAVLPGYHFYKIDPEQRLDEQPAAYLHPLLDLVRKNCQYLFLGIGEYDTQDKCNYNSCFVFGPDGELIGRHRKNHSHGYGGEGWVTNSIVVEPVQVGTVKTGIMVCSDAWYIECPKCLAEQGAELLVDIAGWPISKECGDPLPSWIRCSNETKLPMVLCNQTGNTEWLDFTVGQSVYIEDGEAKLTYSGNDALLLFEWDEKTKRAVSDAFTVINF